ncbi:phosphatase PAP2 family protein [Yinghuangia sp. YIM S09857]|uniref:phosphatase PAP2 family protein n=1 Tax=Yinghuangia sp. YIM S09857 TaxID=3436929 RepID=UPI003F52B144
MHARTPDAGPGTPPRPGPGGTHAGLEQAGGRPGTTPPVPGRWSAYGRSVLASALFPVALAAFLVFLTVQVVADAGPLIPFDEAVRDGVRDLAAASGLGWLDEPMHLLADLGGPVPGGVALVAAYAYACLRTPDRATRLRLAGVAAASVAVVSAIVIGGKTAIDRAGPSGGEITGDEWGFFPSGHTATSAVCFGAAALVLGTVLSPTARRLACAGTSLLCALVGLALLWCDYHWMGDVLASWTLCGIVLWTAARVLPSGGRADRAARSAEPVD